VVAAPLEPSASPLWRDSELEECQGLLGCFGSENNNTIRSILEYVCGGGSVRA
jgi:hypothetical protein